MSRTVDDVPTGQADNFPPGGWHACKCAKTERWTSPKKGTPAVRLTWSTKDGMYVFDDLAFVTPKAVGRLVLIAKRVCGMPGSFEIPDDDREAAKALARYIFDNAEGASNMVEIDETEEAFIYEKGPKIGQKGTKTRSRVAYGGYDRIPAGTDTDTVAEAPAPATTKDDDDLPF